MEKTQWEAKTKKNEKKIWEGSFSRYKQETMWRASHLIPLARLVDRRASKATLEGSSLLWGEGTPF